MYIVIEKLDEMKKIQEERIKSIEKECKFYN